MATKGRQKDLEAYERAARQVDAAFSAMLDKHVPVVSPSAGELVLEARAIASASGEAWSTAYYVMRTLEELLKQGVVRKDSDPNDGRAPERYTKVKGDATYIARLEAACEKLHTLERLRTDAMKAIRGAELVRDRLDVLVVPVTELLALLDGRRSA